MRRRKLTILLISVGLEIVKWLFFLMAPKSIVNGTTFILLFYLSLFPVVVLFGIEFGRDAGIVSKGFMLLLSVSWNALIVYLLILVWRGLKAIKRDW